MEPSNKHFHLLQVLWRQAFISERQKAEDELAQEARQKEPQRATCRGGVLLARKGTLSKMKHQMMER